LSLLETEVKYEKDDYEIEIILEDVKNASNSYTLIIEVIGKCWNSTDDECIEFIVDYDNLSIKEEEESEEIIEEDDHIIFENN